MVFSATATRLVNLRANYSRRLDIHFYLRHYLRNLCLARRSPWISHMATDGRLWHPRTGNPIVHPHHVQNPQPNRRDDHWSCGLRNWFNLGDICISSLAPELFSARTIPPVESLRHLHHLGNDVAQSG